MREDKSLLISYLEQQKMDDSLIHDVVEFREKYETAEEVRERVDDIIDEYFLEAMQHKISHDMKKVR